MSTVTQVLKVYHTFMKAVDDGKEIRVTFLDISKAFDKVWYKGLTFKLQKCGIKGRLLDWFIDYLSDRLQRVVINGQYSDWGQIKAGVPQGSVLGPLLFLLYINDIISCISHCKIRLFADDTCLFIEVDNRETAATLLSEDLSAIAEWAEKWLVTFSPAKTKSLTISNKRDAQLNPPIAFMGRLIDEVESHTYLGLRFSRDLKWRQHINDIAIRTRRKLNLMSPLKMRVDRQSLEIMYKSFVQPTMEYANIVWGGSYDADINKLEQIHLDAMRLVTGVTAQSNTKNVTTEFCGYTVMSCIDQSCLTMMFKIVSGRSPPYLHNILSELNGQKNYSLRNSLNLRIPFCRLECYKRSFFPRTIKLWNKLPVEKRSADSVKSFQKQFIKDREPSQSLYYYGSRWPSVHHARMRIGCSKLNFDLHFNLRVVNSPSCACGAPHESAEHFFFIAHVLIICEGKFSLNYKILCLCLLITCYLVIPKFQPNLMRICSVQLTSSSRSLAVSNNEPA